MQRLHRLPRPHTRTDLTGRRRVCSAKQSSADLDSFFDSLPGTNSHSVLPNARPEHAKHGPKTKTAKHGGKAHRSGHVNKMVEEVAEKEIDADGLPIEVRKKTAQQKQYDLEHEEYEQRLRDYKQQDPDFKEKMDKVHTNPSPPFLVPKC